MMHTCGERPSAGSTKDRAAEPWPIVSTFAWLGLMAGWLELACMTSWRALYPHRSMNMLRTNRHYVWMVPVSEVVIFTVAGLVLALVDRFWPRFSRWLSLRLAMALFFYAVFRKLHGPFKPYRFAVMVLACGVASLIAPWIGRRIERLVRASLPGLVVALTVWMAVSFVWVATSERRALAQLPAAKPGAPNVLLIVLDDVRAVSLSLYGNTRPTTPNLERWARRGWVYSEARSPAPWTLPSHASMFTGRWPHELSVGPDLPLDASYPTLAEVLARNGYATAGFVGNTAYCNTAYGLDRGFARYEDDYENHVVSLFETIRSSSVGRRVVAALGYPVTVEDGETSIRKTAPMLNRDVLNWVEARPAGQPFFVFLNYYDAHSPFMPPDDAAPRFGRGALPLEERIAIERRFVDWKSGKPLPADHDAEHVVDDALELYLDSYESCIAYLDRHLGRLLDEAERRGMLENTLVIVTSDHGEHFGEHGLQGHAQSLYRREVHVPLVIIPPLRSAAAGVVGAPVSLRDVAATIAEWTELGPGNPFPGVSLTRLWNGGDAGDLVPPPSPVICEVQHFEKFPRTENIPSSLGPAYSVVTRDRVYIRSAGGREELFDNRNDPLESDDFALAPEARAELDRLRAELNRLCRGAPGTAVSPPPETNRKRAARGDAPAVRRRNFLPPGRGPTQRAS